VTPLPPPQGFQIYDPPPSPVKFLLDIVCLIGYVRVVIGVLLGVTAVLLALAAVIVSLVALRAPLKANGDVLRAFKALEGDFEEVEQRVSSALGRISRLKREILPTREAEKPAEVVRSSAGLLTPAGSKPLTRGQLLARAKFQSRGGDFDADVEDSARPTGG